MCGIDSLKIIIRASSSQCSHYDAIKTGSELDQTLIDCIREWPHKLGEGNRFLVLTDLSSMFAGNGVLDAIKMKSKTTIILQTHHKAIQSLF